MTRATVGERYQVVIPKRERTRLHLRPHSRVNIEARDRCIIIYPVTGETLRGIGKLIADGTDATDYVRKLRAEWERGR